MSQRSSQEQAIQLQGYHVTQYLHNIMQRDTAILQNFNACRESIMDAVQLYADEQDHALLGKLRGQFVKLIESEHEVQQHKAALQQLSSSYQPSLEKTDFQDTIQQHIQQAQAGSRFSAAADEDLTVFDEVAGNEQQQQEQEMGEEDDLMMVDEGRVTKNEKCPYTLVPVAELADPVEDQMGFIYEKSAILNALKQAQRDRCNWVECPLPGVNHAIMAHHLKPVSKRRLQMLAKVRGKQQQQRDAGTHGNRVVLDIN